jgi:hypothetical protein
MLLRDMRLRSIVTVMATDDPDRIQDQAFLNSWEKEMKTFAAALLGLCLSTVAATAQTNEDIHRALGEVAGELQISSVFEKRLTYSELTGNEPSSAPS